MICFQVYVSPAGLLTVLLKHDVAVEMTLDRTIRVVNHKHKAVAASNSKGTASCIHHGMAKVVFIFTMLFKSKKYVSFLVLHCEMLLKFQCSPIRTYFFVSLRFTKIQPDVMLNVFYKLVNCR